MPLIFGGDGGPDVTLQDISLGPLDLNTNSQQSGAGNGSFTLPDTIESAPQTMNGGVTLNNGVPDNVTNVQRSDGLTVSGVLQGVTATADSLLNTFGKAYTLYNQGQSLQYQAKLTDQAQQLKYAQSQSAIDLAKTKLAADQKLGELNAQSQVANAVAKLQSGAAGYVKSPEGKMTVGVVLAALAGFLLLKKEKVI